MEHLESLLLYLKEDKKIIIGSKITQKSSSVYNVRLDFIAGRTLNYEFKYELDAIDKILDFYMMYIDFKSKF